MLKQRLTHPEILSVALAAAGHGSKVLITDGNYPASTKVGDNAALVYLNLAPGKPTVTEVLDILLTAIPVEDRRRHGAERRPRAPHFPRISQSHA